MVGDEARSKSAGEGVTGQCQHTDLISSDFRRDIGVRCEQVGRIKSKEREVGIPSFADRWVNRLTAYQPTGCIHMEVISSIPYPCKLYVLLHVLLSYLP